MARIKFKPTKLVKKQLEYLEGKDLKINLCNDGIEVETYTDAGGNMLDYFPTEDFSCGLKAAMFEYYKEYDINHEVAIWWPNGVKGTGVPFDNMVEHSADIKVWQKKMLKIVKGMPNDDGTIPDNEEETEQVEIHITADVGCVADFLKDLANLINSEGEDFNQYETCIGCAEIVS